MASARCYTKSGSVEKYESGCFSGAINHYPNNFNSNMTEPDYNGNYSITYNGYDDGDSSNYDCYCETIYGDWRNGSGVKKTFYFKKKGKPIKKYVISIINGPSYDYDDSNYIDSGDAERGKIYTSYYKCIQVVAYYSDNTSKTLSFDDNDNPGFSIYVSYVYYEWEYDTSNQEYNTLNRYTLYTHLSSKEETHIGDTVISRVIFHRGDEDEIDQDEGDQYEQFKIIDGITQINGIPVEH